MFFLKPAQFNEWKLLCNQTFSQPIQYCSGVTLVFSPLLVLAESKYCSGENASESLLPLSSSGIPPHSNHSFYSKEAQHPTPTFSFFPSKRFVFCVHFHSIHNGKGWGGTASFICIFLLLYNFMVFRFNLMWKNEDREIGLSANWLWQKTRTGQFPVKIQAERMRKRKTPSVCSPSPKGRDCRECALTTDPELPPTSPKQTANGHIIWNW